MTPAEPTTLHARNEDVIWRVLREQITEVAIDAKHDVNFSAAGSNWLAKPLYVRPYEVLLALLPEVNEASSEPPPTIDSATPPSLGQ